jgi:hypothetical protein
MSRATCVWGGGSLCFRVHPSLLPVDPKGQGPGGLGWSIYMRAWCPSIYWQVFACLVHGRGVGGQVVTALSIPCIPPCSATV